MLIQFITETKCYDCGNDDQCANEEDNGQLRACPTGSMCYHTSGCKFCISITWILFCNMNTFQLQKSLMMKSIF